MENLLRETPVKVFSLLAVSMVSLGFLLAVSTANASFSGIEIPLPQPPISAEKAMAVLDSVASSYSNFLAINLIEPAEEAVAYHVDSVKALASDFTDGLAMGMTVESVAPQTQNVYVSKPQVAGAYTQRTESSGGVFGVIFRALQ
jgi:hypothetical protein